MSIQKNEYQLLEQLSKISAAIDMCKALLKRGPSLHGQRAHRINKMYLYLKMRAAQTERELFALLDCGQLTFLDGQE